MNASMFILLFVFSLQKYRENFVYGYMSTVQRSFPYLAGAVLGYITVNGKIQVTKVICTMLLSQKFLQFSLLSFIVYSLIL